MSIMSWNCRGLAAPATIRELKELCKAHQPAILFLMETRAQKERVENMRRRLKFHNCFTVDPRGHSGGLCLFWSDKVQIQIFQHSPNYIHTVVSCGDTKDDFDCTFVYGQPVVQQRRGLWSALLAFQKDKECPWVCIGDFNEILAHFEKDGLRPHNHRSADLFRDFLNITGLMDMELKGCAYTWISNPRDGVVIREKLDRVLVNWPWRQVHPNAASLALPIISSDHSPIVLQPFPNQRSGRSFNFELFWAEHEECFGVVEKKWNQGIEDSEPWGQIRGKLKASQKALQGWHSKTFKKADEEICKLKRELHLLLDQEEQLRDVERIRSLQRQIDVLWAQEEMFWGQRARIKWLNKGDRNTKFFHATAIQRRGRNRIQRIKDSSGNWVEGKEETFKVILSHYEEVYKIDGPADMRPCLDSIPKLVSPSMNACLNTPYSEEEIKQAAFSLGALKAPGPDGFNGLFFQKNWLTVKDDLCKAV